MTSTLPTQTKIFDDAKALRAHLGIDVVTPSDPEWDDARLAWNLAVDQRPVAVALPKTADEVVSIVQLARDHGLRVAPQGTGHNANPLDLEGAILLKTERMRGLTIDPELRVARVDAGVLWGEVADAAGEHGLAGLAGSSRDVGVVGYTLGGGLSWLGRSHGLASESVLAVEIVTADGRLVRADAENEPDLFWALRGGGGNFGVVTALEFTLYPVAEAYAGMLVWPIERAKEVMHAWREWTATAPEEITTSARLLQVPPLPDIPETLRGRALVAIDGAYVGDAADGEQTIQALRALEPEIDTFGVVPAAALGYMHMDPPEPVPGRGDHMLLSELSLEALETVIAAAEPFVGSPLLMVELRHLGGALARRAPGAGALGSLDAEFLMFGVGIAPAPEVAAAIERQLAAIKRAMAPWDAGREYSNFAEVAGDRSRLFDEGAYARLVSVRAKYDPADVFRANHPVPAAA